MLRQTCIRFLLPVVLLVAGSLPPTVQAQSAAAVTFDKVLEFLEVGAPEARIMALIEKSPTTFVLGEDQVKKLQAAGASAELIAMMKQRKGSATVGNDITDLIVILDCSGSMNDKMSEGMTKWEAARQAALDLFQGIPEGRRMAFIVYGRDAARRCRSVDVMRPLSPFNSSDRAAMMTMVNSLSAVGQTPIALSLQTAGGELEKATGMASIVLITDGAESCNGNPELEARRLQERFPMLQGGVNVIGFDLKDAESAVTAAIAKAGGGKYYNAQTGNELINSLRKAVRIRVPEAVNFEGVSAIDRLLIEQLADDMRTVRESAAKSLRERKVAAATPAIVNLILDGPWSGGLYADSDRWEAIEFVRNLAPERMAETLGDALQSPNFHVRIWALEAISKFEVAGAVPMVEFRLLSLTDLDVNPGLINGFDEADKLFAGLKHFDKPRLEGLMVKLLRSNFRNVKAWASKRAADL